MYVYCVTVTECACSSILHAEAPARGFFPRIQLRISLSPLPWIPRLMREASIERDVTLTKGLMIPEKGFENEDLGSSPSQWAATVATVLTAVA